VKDVLRRGIVGRQAVDRDEAIGPDMQIKVSMELNTVSRCAAKMAFNMATAVFGAGAMVRPQFNPIRAFIIGTDVIVKPLREEAGGRIVAELDERYVDNLADRRSWQRSRPPPNTASNYWSWTGSSEPGLHWLEEPRGSRFASVPSVDSILRDCRPT
jgi:hypothetical protein